MVRAASVMTNDELQFVTELESVTAPDLVFSSGAIQYHPQPVELLRRLLATRAAFLAIFRTAMTEDGQEFSAVQRASLRAHLPMTQLPDDEESEVLYPLTFAPRAMYSEVLTATHELLAEIDEGVMYQLGGVSVRGYGMLARRR